MTLGIYSKASPMATLEAKRRLGGPLRVLDLALSFNGLFVRAKRNSG